MIDTMTQQADNADPAIAPFTCLVCHAGRHQPGTTTITAERDGTVLVFRKVPASVCDNCDDALVDVDVVRELEQQTRAAIAAGVQTDVRDYVAS